MKRVVGACLVFVAVFIAPGAGIADLMTGLVGYYPFNGNAVDESGNGNDGTVYGAELIMDRFGNPDSAYTFDGVNDYIDVPSSASLQSPTTALTVASWVYIEGWYNGWAAVCAKSDNSGNAQYGYAVNQSNGVYFDVQGTAVTILSSTAFSLDRWYHVAYTWDGAQVKLFVNGQPAGSTPLTRAPLVDARPLQIGRHTPGLTEYLHGALDGLRIFNRALASEEISALAECPDVPESEAAGNCSDGIDNDCDGLKDTDPECSGGSCVGSAEASTFHTGPAHNASDLGKHLAYFLLPVGTLIGLTILRRNR